MIYWNGKMWLDNTDIFTEDDAILYLKQQAMYSDALDNPDDIWVKFYIKNLLEHRDLYSIDVYAWFNTLFQYDIGWENGKQLDSFLYEKDIEPLEMGYSDEKLFREAAKELNLNLDFSHWISYEPKVYMYF